MNAPECRFDPGAEIALATGSVVRQVDIGRECQLNSGLSSQRAKVSKEEVGGEGRELRKIFVIVSYTYRNAGKYVG